MVSENGIRTHEVQRADTLVSLLEHLKFNFLQGWNTRLLDYLASVPLCVLLFPVDHLGVKIISQPLSLTKYVKVNMNFY